jgi:putative ABC transport system permease protein
LAAYERTEGIATVVKFMPLVWAALWRNRTESVLTLLALSVAFALFGTMLTLNAAYQQAIEDTRMDRLIIACAFDCGAVPLGYREQLAQIPGVIAVGAQSWLGGYVADERHPIMVTFVDEGMRAAWPELPLSPADWRALHANPSGVFLSRQAAARYGVRPGDELPVTTYLGSSRADGNPAWYLTVLGFVSDPPAWKSGFAAPRLEPMIVGSLSYHENTIQLGERGLVNLMRVAVDRPENARAVCREIEARSTNATPALYCVPARDDAEETADANINMRQISLGIGAAGLFMILFLCANGVAESVRERLPEFGALKAMGYGDSRIAALVVLEAALPIVLAALIGGALARAADALVAHLADAGVINMPDVHASIASFAWALAVALLIALLSAVAPLYRLRHMDVAAVMAGR